MDTKDKYKARFLVLLVVRGLITNHVSAGFHFYLI